MGTSKKSKNNFMVQGGILAIASLIVRMIGLLYRIPLTNIIGNEGNGYYSNAYEIYNIALILSSYSLPMAISKMVATKNSNKEYNNSFKIFTASMTFAAAAGGLMTVIIYFGADLIAKSIYKDIGIGIPLKILAPTIFIVAILGVFRGFFQGKNTMIPTSISQVLEQIINAAVSIGAAYVLMNQFSLSEHMAAYGAAGGTLGTCIGALAALLFVMLVFVLYWPTIHKQRKKDISGINDSYKTIYKVMFLTIIPIIVSQTVYQLSGIIDSMMFSSIMNGQGIDKGMRAILFGTYSTKYRVLTNVPVAIASSFAAALIPSVVSAYTRGDYFKVATKIQSAIKFNMIIAIPSAVGMGVLASPILNLLFRDSTKLPADLMRIGCIAIVFFALSTVTNAVLQGINKMRIPVIHSSISLAIHIVLLYVLLHIFNFGVYGLVIGNVTFPLVVCILNWISIRKHLNYNQEIYKTFIIPTISAIIMGVVTWLTYTGVYKLITKNAIATTFAIIVAIIVYFMSLVLLKGVSEEELLNMPKGFYLVKLSRRLKLIR